MDADDLADQFEDKASVRAAAGKNGGGRKAGGGGGGKGKPGDGGKQREKQISMALSRLLRHQALNAGIKLDKEGYAPLDRVVSAICFLLAVLQAGLSLSSPPLVRLEGCRPRVGLILSTMLFVTTSGPLCTSIYLAT